MMDDNRYTFEIRIIRNPRKDGEQPKPVTTLTYHALNYGALVQVEKAVTDKLLPALSEMGLKQAAELGYPTDTGK